MKIFNCPICNQPQECDDKVGDSCKVYHHDCIMAITKDVREYVQKNGERREAERKALHDKGL